MGINEVSRDYSSEKSNHIMPPPTPTRILLLNPPLNLQDLFGKYKDSGGLTYLNGLAMLSGVAKQQFRGGVEIKIVDAEVEELTLAEVKDLFRTFRPDILGLTSMTPLIYSAYKCAAAAKEVRPETFVILGGPHITEEPDGTLAECGEIDVGVLGEGELTFVDLIRFVKTGLPTLADIDGIIFRNGETGKVTTRDRKKIRDLDELPFPDYGQFRMDLYNPPVHKYKIDNTFSIVTSRGCPYSCTFCSTAVHTKKYRTYSPERVVDEIQFLKESYGARGITIQDSLFTMHRRRVVEICENLIERQLNIKWAANARVDQVDKELLTLMKRAGCWVLAFGVESGNQHMLDQMKKKYKLDRAPEAIRMTREARIETRASYLLGLPGETYESAMKTIAFAKDIASNVATFHFAVPFPGTELLTQCRSDSNYQDIPWGKMVLMGDRPLFVPSTISESDLISLYNLAWKTYYFTPKVVYRNLTAIRSFTDVRRYYVGAKTIFSRQDKHKEFACP